MIDSWARAEGLPYPLGVSRASDGSGLNFALYSKRATTVKLLLFAPGEFTVPHHEVTLDPLRHKSGRIWHVHVPTDLVGKACYYGYVVDGPPPNAGYEIQAFRPEKLLFDPYARALYFPPAFDRAAAIGQRPTLGLAPLSVIETCDHEFDWGDDCPPRHESDAVIYELHVRGFTMDDPDLHPSIRGTFDGVVAKIPYLVELGVNVVELMPVFQKEPQSGDYWGYMTMAFFAPDQTYAGNPADPREAITAFKRMVKALHAADIEVVLDVVYSHTAEAGPEGPTYSYKGIDHATYYVPTGFPARYADFAGTGNTLDCTNRCVRKMIVDSMRYWVTEMRVDGFRFDLASVFSRNPDGSINTTEPPIFGDITSNPAFDHVRMIAEPWDAAGAYELGRAFPGTSWLQWNDRFRDDVRRFVRGDGGHVGALMQRLYGSDDVFPDDAFHAYHAFQSINFVTCHDGFTLYDLVAYDKKHNLANGWNDKDGNDQNWSWNSGHEGDDGADGNVLALRERQARNFLALLFLANGTPMLRAGDELLQTQGGNNNPYNQDTATSWLDWTRRETRAGFLRFVQRLVAFRKAHRSLGRSRFWRDDVKWFGPDGPVDFGPNGRSFAMALHGGSQRDDDLYVMINGTDDPVRFAIGDTTVSPWRRVADTARSSPDDFVDEPVPLADANYIVRGRSIVILVRESHDDNYRWLEDVTGDRALAWVRERNRVTQRELEARPDFGATRDRIRAILDSKDKTPFVTKRGPLFYNLWQDATNPRGLVRRTTLASYKTAHPVWETVLDIDALAAHDQVSWVYEGSAYLYPEQDRSLIQLSRGGADAVIVREFDPVAKQFVVGGFELPESKTTVAWKDRDTLYVGTDFGPGSMTTSGYPRIIKEWKRGTPLAEAITIYEGQETDVSVAAGRSWDHGTHYDFVSRGISFYASEMFLRDASGALIKLDVPLDAGTDIWNGQLLVTLRSDWDEHGKKGALIAMPFVDFLAGKRAFTTLFEPTANRSLEGTTGLASALIVNELCDVHNELAIWRLAKGAWTREPFAAAAGLDTTTVWAVESGGESDDYWMTTTGFLTPSTLALGSLTAKPEQLKVSPAFFDTTGLVVEQHFATSADGTRIPYFQISRDAIALDGSHPTILYGYGGFEISLTPGYNPISGAAWTERGGVYVIANIRGGGEYGPRWHQAALKANRQRAYDDFIAVGEDLIARGVTATPHLGIQGGSNGGLLMGVMLTQRPDLWGAVVCQAPLLDMRRYHELLAGASWMEEYGDPDEPEQWAYISGYSPYQNVKPGRAYPRTLFTTSTRDDRVHPGHARKMMARVLESGHDALYYENIEGGHSGSADAAQQAYMSALAYAFFASQLGLR